MSMGAIVTRCKYYGGPSHDGLPVMYNAVHTKTGKLSTTVIKPIVSMFSVRQVLR